MVYIIAESICPVGQMDTGYCILCVSNTMYIKYNVYSLLISANTEHRHLISLVNFISCINIGSFYVYISNEKNSRQGSHYSGRITLRELRPDKDKYVHQLVNVSINN